LQTQNACRLIWIFVAVKKDVRVSIVAGCNLVNSHQCGAAIQRAHEGQQAFVTHSCQIVWHY